MNIFQLQKKARKAKNIIRRANQQLTRVQAKGYENEKEANLQFRISKASTFLEKVGQWEKDRAKTTAFRSSLPKREQRKLGLLPSVELFNEWRAAGHHYVVQSTEDGGVTYPIMSDKIDVIRGWVKQMVDEKKVNLTKLKVFKIK
jgi:hypothetical protein